jgi:hypothetical protein
MFKPDPFHPPLFELKDVNDWKSYFQENGYVVIKNIIDSTKIDKAKTLLWDFLTKMGTGIKEDDETTWSDDRWPGTALKKGIVSGYGAGQSDFMWSLREVREVRIPFAELWNCDIGDLVPSFDGFSIFRPINKNPFWKTDNSLWYHVDQNGHDKPSFACVQGQVILLDSNEKDGGFVLIPQSHKVFSDIFQRFPNLGKDQIDFIRFNPNDHDSPWYHEFVDHQLTPVKLCVPAGSLILWDSRTTHCNCAAEEIHNEIPNRLRRITAFISFAPRSQLTESDIIRRQECFSTGGTSTHWINAITHPHERSTRPINFLPPNLTDEQKQLIC